MNNIAIAFLTKDRVELSYQSIVPLLQHDKFDLYWCDGSDAELAIHFPETIQKLQAGTFGADVRVYHNVRAGADAAIVFALTEMLKRDYDFIGLCENDVLLDLDWFLPTLDLFEKGERDGLAVGAVSARTYVDRILCQRDGYALMHNLGAGHIIFTRKAAELLLKNYRTGHRMENRRTFMQLSGLDIARWNSFVRENGITTADWQFDRILAQHGLASLALTPCKATMIGQDPPLEEQGLQLVTAEIEARRDDKAFNTFVSRAQMLREGWFISGDSRFLADGAVTTVFPHQIEALGGSFEGTFQLKWSQGFGPFAYRAEENAAVHMNISGPCSILVSDGAAQVNDAQTGFEQIIEAPPNQIMQMAVPAGVAYRDVTLRLSPGAIFYGVSVNEPQFVMPNYKFDHSRLPTP